MIDLHNDFLTALKTKHSVKSYLNKNKKYCSKIYCAVWATNLNFNSIRYKLSLLPAQCPIKLCTTIEDISNLTIEQVLQLSPTTVTLTWNGKNRYAGGANSSGGLTAYGRQAIHAFEKAGIQIDTVHLNRKSFWQLARITTRPLLCSHTCCNDICNNNRNLTRSQLTKINSTGGTVGITLVKDFLTNKNTCTIADVLNHINFAKRYCKNTFIGTDFYGTTQLPQSITNYKSLTQSLNTALSPQQTTIQQPPQHI